MRGIVLGSLAACAVVMFGQAQPGIEGHWQGTLDAGQAKLRLAFHITKAPGGKLAGTMDSLDQGAMGLPLDAVSFEGGKARFELRSVGGRYEGTLSKDGSELSGVWKQGDISLPLFLKRTEKPTELKRPQEPVKPYPYNEEEVVYENHAAGVKLAGSLTLPRSKGPFPAVVLISGSGPQDRNEAVAGHKIFLVLGDYLTRQGIAVLRSDDRGVGGSTGSLSTVTTEGLAGDTMAAVEFLKKRKDIDLRRIGLIGHSEGGLIAPMVATRSSDIAFLVLLAGPAVTGEQILYKQSESIMRAMRAPDEAIGKARDQQVRIFSILKQEKDNEAAEKKLREIVETNLAALEGEQRTMAEAAAKAQIQTLLSPWFRYFLSYDPAPTLAKVKQPLLALYGELDAQVPPDQNLPVIEKALKAGGNPDAQARQLPKLNHLFQTAKTGAPTEYAQIEETFAPTALEAIGAWIGKHAK